MNLLDTLLTHILSGLIHFHFWGVQSPTDIDIKLSNFDNPNMSSLGYIVTLLDLNLKQV